MKLYETLIEKFADAQDSQLSKKLRKECRDFDLPEKSDRDVYDFRDYLAKQPVTKASDFVKAVSEVDKYYKRPEE